MKIKIKDILEIIFKAGRVGIYALEIFTLGQGRVYKNLRRKVLDPFYFEKIMDRKVHLEESWGKSGVRHFTGRPKRQNLYSLLFYLQKQGLVEKHNNRKSRQSYWTITKRGERKLEYLQKSTKDCLPKKIYKTDKDDDFRIVIFDIPEEERQKRNWLRFNLFNLGFKQLQKSVWIGNNKLPIEFIEDIENLNMFPYVEIFSIGKAGTIKDIVKDSKKSN